MSIKLDFSPDRVRGLSSVRNGNANPELVDNAFWTAMIRSREPALRVRKTFGIPTCAWEQWRTLAGRSSYRLQADGPIWCFVRWGRTVTQLRDGRVVHVGGHHEDWYDCDFCIYNDVIVEAPDGTFEIYIYPEHIFPPTDFHSATIVDDGLILVGSLGYRDLRRGGETQVSRLDLHRFSIEPVETFGDGPGWLHGHEAEFHPAGNELHVRGGRVWEVADGREVLSDCAGAFALSLTDQLWRRLE